MSFDIDAERQKVTHEIFTPPDLSLRLLDLFNDDYFRGNVLEPTCGNGNIVEMIILRKLSIRMTPEEAVSTTFAADLMQDNVQACQERVLAILGDAVTPKIQLIVHDNIVCADYFKWDHEKWSPRTVELPRTTEFDAGSDTSMVDF